MTELTHRIEKHASKEKDRRDLKLDWIPGFEETNILNPQLLSRFNPEIYRANLRELKSLNVQNIKSPHGSKEDKAAQDAVAGQIAYLERAAIKFSSVLSTLGTNSYPIESTLPTGITSAKGGSPTEQMQRAISAPGNHLFLTDSHVSTYFLLKELRKKQIQNTGMIIFDQHIDLYNTSLFEYGDERVGKQNFISHALIEDPTLQVAILGPSKDHIKEMRSVIRKTLPVDAVKRVLFIEEPVADPRGIKKLFDQFSNTQVKQLLTSVDIDVFNWATDQENVITACDFSLINGMVPFGVYKLDQIAQSAERTKSALANMSYESKIAHSFVIESVYEPGDRMIAGRRAKAAIYKPDTRAFVPRIVTPDEVSMAIAKIRSESAVRSIQFGVELDTHRRVIGDINELEGYDFNGNTGRAVQQVVDSLK